MWSLGQQLHYLPHEKLLKMQILKPTSELLHQKPQGEDPASWVSQDPPLNLVHAPVRASGAEQGFSAEGEFALRGLWQCPAVNN